MSYEKNEWQTGDTITATKLNHMEDGIAGGGGVLVVNSVYDEQADTTTLDKTWQQIHDADYCILKVIYDKETDYSPVIAVAETPFNKYKVTAINLTEQPFASIDFECDTADDYPVRQDN